MPAEQECDSLLPLLFTPFHTQVIQLLRDAFVTAGLDLYLCPYGCLPTGYEKGIIEVVPNTRSRAAMGELSDRGLYEIFQAEFGQPNTPAFEAARRNFIISEAGYAIASFLLQVRAPHRVFTPVPPESSSPLPPRCDLLL
jgi:phosphatidylinositol kinase/protein kinase (PI-3  family)